jgi:DNA-binding MarR family transcriptional regulator
MDYDQLKLSNQICFPVYAASRLITREYQRYLDEMGITYPQYLVLLVLWETDGILVSEITQKLILNTNTVTPLLKRMEVQGILTRTRSGNDERKVVVTLTAKGKTLRIKASSVPDQLLKGLNTPSLAVEDLIDLRNKLNSLIGYLIDKEKLSST